MTSLPSGTLTLLFSDIEGSTALLHRLGPRWGEALSAHRRILRAAFARHDGTEIGTEGDSFFVVFPVATEAVEAAVEAQRGLYEHDWPDGVPLRVRIGLHTGSPTPHEDGYVGEDVHRAARIAATAHGGQIVLSDATCSLLGSSVPGGAVVRDVGRHRLKDLDGEQQLFDLRIPGLPDEFAPLRSLGRVAALPRPAYPLVGREAELADLVRLLADPDVRLVTLTGPGGTGKTRLALAAAAAGGAHFADGVYFARLDAAVDADAAWAVLAETVDADQQSADDPAAAVSGRLAGRRALLVLDNLEQIADADRLVAALHDGAPDVTVLATSRRPLMLAAEREMPVEPLALPVDDGLEAALAAPAVQLFAARARAVRPGFTVTGADHAEVVALCRRLDGLPLALELAAARIRLLGPGALLRRLDASGVDTAAGGRSGAVDRPQRQRTLDAAISWSYDLLPDADQAVFRRLSVLRAPADLDAVQRVVGGDDDVLEVVSRLVEASLLRVLTGTDGEPRIVMLQTIRDVARSRLTERGEGEHAGLAHLRWCHEAVATAVDGLLGPRHLGALDRLAALELDIRAALDFGLRPALGMDGHERLSLALELLVTATTRYWYLFGSIAECRAWQERGTALTTAADGVVGIGLAHGLGMSLVQQGDWTGADRCFERALAAAERLDDSALQARELNALAVSARNAGDTARAESLLTRCLAAADAAGDPTYRATALTNLAVVHLDLGSYAEAARCAEQSMAANSAAGDEWSVAVDRVNYLTAVLMDGGAADACRMFVEWAPEVAAFHDHDLDLSVIELGAALCAATGAAADAAALMAEADARRAAMSMPRSPGETALMTAALAPARTALGLPGWDAAYRARGDELTPADAVASVAALATRTGA